MKYRLLIAGLFLVLTACANTHVDQRSCTHDCHANSHPTPSYPVVTGPVYYQPRTMNCVRGYYGGLSCGYVPY